MAVIYIIKSNFEINNLKIKKNFDHLNDIISVKRRGANFCESISTEIEQGAQGLILQFARVGKKS